MSAKMADDGGDSTPRDCDEYTLKIEAESVVKEIAYSVKCVKLSEVLPSADNMIYLNLHTKENQKYCVQLSKQGFQIVGRDFDSLDDDVNNGRFFETIYSLLDNVSPEYRNSFGDVLFSRLQKVKEQQVISERDDIQ